jgi:hypothetical protein
VRYTAPGADLARVELIDLSGRVLDSREVAADGTHELELVPAPRIAPGLYLLRIRQGSEQRVARISLLR